MFVVEKFDFLGIFLVKNQIEVQVKILNFAQKWIFSSKNLLKKQCIQVRNFVEN